MHSKKTDEINERTDLSVNSDHPVIRIPKCREAHEPPGYFDPVGPYKNQPAVPLDFRGLLNYAQSVQNDITELSYDEVGPFLGNRKESANHTGALHPLPVPR